MRLVIKYMSNPEMGIDLYETELETIQTAMEPFTAQQLLDVLQSNEDVAAEYGCNLRRVTSLLNTLDTHMGGHRVSEHDGMYTANHQAFIDFRM